MTRISILYPDAPGARFDMGYYVEKHMPLSIGLLSRHRGFRGVAVEKGTGGATPESPPAYRAMCHFSFDSAADFLEAFLPHASVLQGDIANYTDIAPVVQFSEVVLAR
ncbi:MAG TPA: EthD family reductase [Burkholderiales bacterium]|nr:EthD family reductase [Burkholderiales bacterium]